MILGWFCTELSLISNPFDSHGSFSAQFRCCLRPSSFLRVSPGNWRRPQQVIGDELCNEASLVVQWNETCCMSTKWTRPSYVIEAFLRPRGLLCMMIAVHIYDKFQFRAVTHEINQIAVHNTKATDKGTPYWFSWESKPHQNSSRKSEVHHRKIVKESRAATLFWFLSLFPQLPDFEQSTNEVRSKT